jgi:hypothetical protein
MLGIDILLKRLEHGEIVHSVRLPVNTDSRRAAVHSVINLWYMDFMIHFLFSRKRYLYVA